MMNIQFVKSAKFEQIIAKNEIGEVPEFLKPLKDLNAYIDLNNNPWFLMEEVTEKLKINVYDAFESLALFPGQKYFDNCTGKIYISEAGLYNVFLTNKAKASEKVDQFDDGVFSILSNMFHYGMATNNINNCSCSSSECNCHEYNTKENKFYDKNNGKYFKNGKKININNQSDSPKYKIQVDIEDCIKFQKAINELIQSQRKIIDTLDKMLKAMEYMIK